jgi:internalin A
LPNLTILSLTGNQISDVSQLPILPNLIKLYLNNNQISDISTLPVLPNIVIIDLSYNQISDISSAFSNLRMQSNHIKLHLEGNPIINKIQLPIDLSINSANQSKLRIFY